MRLYSHFIVISLMAHWSLFSWLSQAELSSFARSEKILPQSIYLSHQFSFHTLAKTIMPPFETTNSISPGRRSTIGSTDQRLPRESPSSRASSCLETSETGPFHSHLTNLLHLPSPVSIINLGVLPMLPNGMPGAQSFLSSP